MDLKGSVAARHEKRSAFTWIMGRREEFVITFSEVCEALNLNPKETRQKIICGKAEDLSAFTRSYVDAAADLFDDDAPAAWPKILR